MGDDLSCLFEMEDKLNYFLKDDFKVYVNRRKSHIYKMDMPSIMYYPWIILNSLSWTDPGTIQPELFYISCYDLIVKYLTSCTKTTENWGWCVVVDIPIRWSLPTRVEVELGLCQFYPIQFNSVQKLFNDADIFIFW